MFVYLRKKKVLGVSYSYSNRTNLLVKAIGANNSTNNTFLDSSPNNLTITRAGNVSQGAVSPYNPNGYSAYFGSGNYLTIPANTAFDITGGDFTVECWVNLDKYNPLASNGMVIATNMTNTLNGWEFGFQGVSNITALTFRTFTSSGASLTTCTGVTSSNFLLDIWNHIAVTREGSNFKFYLNGNLVGTYPATVASAGGQLAIGVYQHNLSSPSWVQGRVSNLRIVKGSVVYTSNFTPSKIPLTAISGTSLLILQSNRFIDNSLNNFGVTVTGAPRILNSPFSFYEYSTSVNGGSVYLDGTGDYLTAGSNANLALGSGNFTIEFWWYPYSSVFNGGHWIINSYTPGSADATGAFNLYAFVNATVDFNIAGVAVCNTGVMSQYVNTWVHVALVRNNNVVTCYINGIAKSSGNNSTSLTKQYFRLGAAYDGLNTASEYFSDVRLTNTAVYTSNFTPPNSPLIAITGTKLLLSGTNAKIIDKACKCVIESVADTKVSTLVTRNGASSFYFDGNGDYLTIPDSKEYQFNADYTIEFSFRADSVAYAVQGLINKGYGFSIVLSSNSIMVNLSSTNTTSYFISGTIANGLVANTWYHVAFIKSGTTYYGFCNGVRGYSSTNAGIINTGTSPIRIGATSDNYYFNGYISDVKISNHASFYSSAITVPTALFPTVNSSSESQFQNNLLLLKGLSANNANNNTIIDSSPTNITITRNGNVSQGSFTPYNSAYSTYFDNTSSNYLNISASEIEKISVFAGRQTTIEGWVNVASFAASTGYTMGILGNVVGIVANGMFAVYTQGTSTNDSYKITFYWTYASQYGTFVTSSNTLELNKWHHIAVCIDAINASNTTITIYLNGKGETFTGKDLSTQNIAGSGGNIGTSPGVQQFNGSMYGLRVTRSIVYTGDFTPSDTNSILQNTVMLMFTGRRISDACNNVVTTTVGSPRIIGNTPSKTRVGYDSLINGGAAFFDGTGDYLVTASSSEYGLGTGDFTAECFFYPYVVTSGSGMVLIDFRTNGSNSNSPFLLLETNGSINYFSSGAARIVGTVLVAYQWYHVAVVRSSGSTKLYLNGVQVGSTYSDTGNYYSSNRVCIGADDDGSPNAYFNGYISGVRVDKSAIYTSTFTPSNVPLIALSNTKLLCNFTNAYVFDATGNTSLETLGNTKVSTTITKYTPSSFYFDGTSGCCIRTSPFALNCILNSDYTIELWYYRIAGSIGNLFRSTDSGGNIPGISLLDNNGTLAYKNSTDGITENIVGSGGAINTNAWNHIVHRRVGSLFSLYLNGVLTATSQNGNTLYNPATASLSMASIGGTNSTNCVTGYISDCRVTGYKGRYTVEPTSELVL